MGMSASQIRYCMLLGRKSDIEYQGQQINQQRTTLATQSSAYNTQMLTLSVPTPPSSEEYTVNTYDYTINGQEYSIKGISKRDNEYTLNNSTKKYPAGTYVIDYTTNEVKQAASKDIKCSVTKSTANGATTYTVVVNNKTYTLSSATGMTSASDTDQEHVLHTTNMAQIKKDIVELKDDTAGFMYTVIDGNYLYFSNTDLAGDLTTNNKVQTYSVATKPVETKGQMGGVSINWTDTGRMASIRDEFGNDLSLSITTVTDEEAYNNAYNEYLYQKDQYNKAIDDINASLEVVQAQDKKLELQLTNLDTQENAINTEMDAVKKVVEGNIEKSFTVFG